MRPAVSHSAIMEQFGTPTMHTRVETWECDYNDHWNTRFFGRAFHAAAAVVAGNAGRGPGDAELPAVRHVRFHRELRATSNVEVRSARLRNADKLDDAILHILTGDGRLAATALDTPGIPVALPTVDGSDVPLALPRGLAAPALLEEAPGASAVDIQLGPVDPRQCDSAGKLLFEELVSFASVASSSLLRRAGLTEEFTERTRTNRMAVEMRSSCYTNICAGTLLQARSRQAGVSTRRFRTEHRIETVSGDPVALLEFCLVTVDIDSRRAVPIPDELRVGLQNVAG